MTPASGAPGSAPSSTPLKRALEDWRRELTGLAGPDPLLAHRDVPFATLDLSTAHPSGVAAFLAGRPTRLSDLFREQTVLVAARERARHVRAAATRLVDGYGLPGSSLAVGMLGWNEADGTVVRGPVLLRSLTLRPRGPGGADFDLDLDGPTRVNEPLLRLLQRRGVQVRAAELLDLAGDAHGFTPRRSLDRLRERLSGMQSSGMQGVTVTDRTLVGIFPDLGPALVEDLDRIAGDLARHRFVQALLGAGTAAADLSGAAAGGECRGPVRAPRDGELVPLDPSQRAVVEAVGRGRDLRVEAPVGSGATQVAAQLVVDAARTGRSLLVVAPRRGPLDDVVARLQEHGLGRLLPVGSFSDSDVFADVPADVPADPGADPGAGTPAVGSETDRPGPASALSARTALLDARTRWGTSRLAVLESLVRLTPAGAAPADPTGVVELPVEALRALAVPQSRTAAAELLAEAADVGAFDEAATSSPWVGSGVTSAQDVERALAAVDRLRNGSLARASRLLEPLARGVGLGGGRCVADREDQLELFVSVRATLDTFLPAVHERSLDEVVAATATGRWRDQHGVRMGTLERRRWRKQARELLRPGTTAADLHAGLVTAAAEREQWQRISGSEAQPQVPSGLDAAIEAHREVVADLAVLEPLLDGTAGHRDLRGLPLAALGERLDQLAAARSDLAVLPRRTTVLASLHHQGLGALVEQLHAEGARREVVASRLERVWLLGVLAAMEDEDRAHLDLSAGRSTGARRADPGSGPRTSALAVTAPALPHVLNDTRAHRRPVLPRVVDTVLLLDAQRLGLAESVAAIARGRQVVLLANPDGLRPGVLDVHEDVGAPGPPERAPDRTCVLDAAADRVETLVLDHRHRTPAQVVAVGVVATAGGSGGSGASRAGPRPRWQVPAPPGPVLRLDVVPAGTVPVTATAEDASPPEEVRRVVELVLEHVREHADQSLAVLTLGRAHARTIAEGVRGALAADPSVVPWFARPRQESFVVTDVSHAEDTVRDHVLLALGLGRTPHGRVVHRFGRLDQDGGDRLLGLGIAQARQRLTVVSSLTADQLDPERTSSDGARAVRRVLEALGSSTGLGGWSGAWSDAGARDDSLVENRVKDHPVLELLVASLRAAGHEVIRPGRLPVPQPVAADEDMLDLGPSGWRPDGLSADAGEPPDPAAEPHPSAEPDLVVRVAGGSRPVAVLWDGRRSEQDPVEVVTGDAVLEAALRRFGWGVLRARSTDVVLDAEAVLAQVVRAAGAADGSGPGGRSG